MQIFQDLSFPHPSVGGKKKVPGAAGQFEMTEKSVDSQSAEHEDLEVVGESTVLKW